MQQMVIFFNCLGIIKGWGKWHDESYLSASDSIQHAILEHTLVKTENYSVLLPGINGFKTPKKLSLTPPILSFRHGKISIELVMIVAGKI